MRRTTRIAVMALAGLLLAPRTTPAQDRVDPARERSAWAVIVGIDGYDDPAIPACSRSIAEGIEFEKWLIETALWDRRHLLLMNKQGEKKPGQPEDPIGNLIPTRENLDWATTEWVGHRVKNGDLVVFYFAGQAAVTSAGMVLLPIDARSEGLARSGWSPEKAIDTLAGEQGCAVVCWLDTSPRGRGRPVTSGPVDAPASPAGQMLDRLTRWPRVSVWLAGSEQPSAEGPFRSPFAAALQAGLGTRPGNLLACLHRLNQDPALAAQGFRYQGGLPPDLSLWPSRLVPAHKFRPELLLQHGHADAVTAIATTADGERTISASSDSTIRIWRTRDRTLLGILPGHTIGVTALDLAADGQLLASGDGAGQVRVWDLAGRRPKPPKGRGPSPHLRRIARLAFLPGGAWLVSLDQDGRCVFWDVTGPEIQSRSLTRDNYVQIATASRAGPAAVALADSEGMLYLLDIHGTPTRDLGERGGRPTALQLAPDGSGLAAGDSAGRLRVWNTVSGKLVFRRDYNVKITAIGFDPGGHLAVAAGRRLFLADLDRKEADLMLAETAGEVDQVRFTADGRWLTALTADADLHLWDLSAAGQPLPRPVALDTPSSGFTALAFSPDGKGLVAGEAHGAIRSWDLPGRRERPRIPPHRGKVDALAVSADGRYLLQVNHEGTALLWDLQERAVHALDGRWVAGAFLPDGNRLVMTRDPDEKEGGEVVLLDRSSGRLLRRYPRPPAEGGGRSQVDFGPVAVARDGRRLASSAAPGRAELACVWEVEGGPPRTIRGKGRSLTALDLSATGLLLAAGADGARVWDLTNREGDPTRPVAVLPAAEGQEMTAARFCPTDPRRVLTASWAPGHTGQVDLWDWAPGRAGPARRLGQFDGRVHAVAFTPDGRWAAAAGQDRLLRVWDLAAARPREVEIEPDHPESHHLEQVNALVAAPGGGGGPLLVSGGDDTTIRIWGLDPNAHRATLLGTLSAALSERPDAGRPRATPSGIDWVAYTPDGVHDASLDGDRLVRFSFGWESRSLEQYARRFYRFRLTDDLRRGIRPPAPPQTPPPPLAIEVAANRDDRRRDVEIRIALPDPNPEREGLRLYQDGKPLDGPALRPLEGAGRFAVSVRLRPGLNQFYAMAERRDDVDARSPVLELFYDGPEPPGRLHILALGVSQYARNSLQFADRDAVAIADFLHQHGNRGPGPPGVKVVLTDGAVTEKRVEDAFAEIRRAVHGQPQDTVVVFLAGHTAVLKEPSSRERFSLLLPAFPFDADAPLLTDNRGVRAAASGGPLPVGIDLPFYAIYRNLTKLEALQRLVIIDACQAEAIFNDPGVRMIQEMTETEARRGRTSYILATRRGEPAGESKALEHGLLTYVLLRGMRAPGLRPVTARVPALEELLHADQDTNGVVTTWELYDYAERVLPDLAGVYPQLAQRSGGVSLAPVPAAPQALRLQAAESSFPLIELPADPPGVAGAPSTGP